MCYPTQVSNCKNNAGKELYLSTNFQFLWSYYWNVSFKMDKKGLESFITILFLVRTNCYPLLLTGKICNVCSRSFCVLSISGFSIFVFLHLVRQWFPSGLWYYKRLNVLVTIYIMTVTEYNPYVSIEYNLVRLDIVQPK